MNPAAEAHAKAIQRASLIMRVFNLCARDSKNIALRRVLNTMTNAQIREVLERMT